MIAVSDHTREVAPPPVDVDAFRSMMREAGAEDVVDAILEVFEADVPMRAAAVAAAMASGDATEIRNTAHAFKSSAGSIKARTLAAVLQQIEIAGSDQRVNDARALSHTLRAEVETVLVYLRQLPMSASAIA